MEAFVSSPSCGCLAHLTRLLSHRVEKQPMGVWTVRVPRTCRVVNDLSEAGTACDMPVLGSMSGLILFNGHMIEWIFECPRLSRDRALWNDSCILKFVFCSLNRTGQTSFELPAKCMSPTESRIISEYSQAQFFSTPGLQDGTRPGNIHQQVTSVLEKRGKSLHTFSMWQVHHKKVLPE